MIRQFHHSDFLPLELYACKKRELGAIISLVLPAVNEGATIGAIVAESRRQCIEYCPLLDEIVVMDGASTDDTARNARQAGAKVLTLQPAAGSARVGKGAAMRESLRHCRGDIILFLDADITDFTSRFIHGLLGPLLADPGIFFVKAWYRRPLTYQGVVQQTGGGRVTEILARPMLAAFYPELSYLFQPLAGECAVRRRVIEQLPFSSGYGVDIGIVLEVYRRFGLTGIAQVDLDVRSHRNREIGELGKMAFAILRTFLHNCRKDGKITMAGELEKRMITVDGGEWSTRVIEETELPPVMEHQDVTGLEWRNERG
jgi:glucosyl-3-phosphoglycerate synthase